MNRYYKFLLITPRGHADAAKIRDEVERNRFYKVQIVDSAVASLEEIVKGTVNCLVYNFDTFDVKKIKLITDLRDLGYVFPVIIFASHIQKEAIESVRDLKFVVVIEKPFEAKDVWGICYKMVQGRKVSQRIYRRFYTNQSARLQKSMSGETIEGQIYNMSHGGAYMEVSSESLLNPGDTIKLTVQLDRMSRTYNVDAQVVWATKRGYWEGKPAVGLRFIKAGDVYKNLLSKL